MTSRVAQVFGQVPAVSTSATSTNRDGYPAWERVTEEQLVQTLLTNTLSNVFYATADELLEESKVVHSAALAADPEFYARALVFARNAGYMRSQPVYGLALLSELPPAQGHLFEAAFGQVIRTPDDLRDFLIVVKSRRRGEGGRRVKRVIGKWLGERLGEYWAIKYGADRTRGEYSLRDIILTTHPKLGAGRDLIDYVLGESLMRKVDLSSLPQVAAFEALKRAETDEERARLITEGRLPHEVASPFAGKSLVVWRAIVPQMPVFALLRHLATLERHQLAEEFRGLICEKFASREAIEKAKLLPYRFIEAEAKVTAGWLKDAMRDAVELAYTNLPDLAGETVVALDRSGSMNGKQLETGSIFALCLLKKSYPQGKFYLFDDSLQERAVSMRDSLLTQARAILAGGNTHTSLPVEELLRQNKRVDNYVCITDGQQNGGEPFADVFQRYREQVNHRVKLFVVDVSPYRNALVPSSDGQSWYCYGWSDQVLSFIGLASQGFGSMVDRIRALPLVPVPVAVAG